MFGIACEKDHGVMVVVMPIRGTDYTLYGIAKEKSFICNAKEFKAVKPVPQLNPDLPCLTTSYVSSTLTRAGCDMMLFKYTTAFSPPMSLSKL